uniref:Uncharacterized protein n=1 Tax=Vespula pensylvanica TaxID=30213 RepID=A0A834P360_VESPE|nr:hypothetical protein H0235_008327 [Vespula pensylvanica]
MICFNISVYQKIQIILIIFQNYLKYDANFIIKDFGNFFIPGRITILTINKERYISLSKHINEYNIEYRFIDSFNVSSLIF